MRELDSAVGKILASLRSLKIDNNTLVFFSSDNGGATYAKQHGIFLSSYLFFMMQLPAVHICMLVISEITGTSFWQYDKNVISNTMYIQQIYYPVIYVTHICNSCMYVPVIKKFAWPP